MKYLIRIRTIILCLAITLSLVDIPVALASEYSNQGYTYDDLSVLESLMTEQQEAMEAAHGIAEGVRSLGYDESHEVILFAQDEYAKAHDSYYEYKMIYEDLSARKRIKEDEYPAAAYIWSELREAGYNDEVVAGIMGNLMVEVGGYTLDLEVDNWTGSYYGICQWNSAYSQIWNANLEEQCDFLLATIKYELDTYGYMYKKGFDYNDFVEMSNPSDAALAFAKSYERCSSASYKQRQKCAVQAYNYFVT